MRLSWREGHAALGKATAPGPGPDGHWRAIAEKFERIGDLERRSESRYTDDADTIVVAFGTAAKFVEYVVEELRAQGIGWAGSGRSPFGRSPARRSSRPPTAPPPGTGVRAEAPGETVGTVESTARRDAEEAARAVGVDFIVNTVTTMRRGIAGVAAGDLVAAHRVGVALAQRIYDTQPPSGADICVLSSYPKDNEFLQYGAAFTPLQSSPEPLVRDGGSVVMAAAGSEGAGFHSLFSPGMHFAGPLMRPPGEVDFVLFSPGVAHGDLPDSDRETAQLFATWDQTVRWLTAKHGAAASVSVFPCAVTQLVTEVG